MLVGSADELLMQADQRFESFQRKPPTGVDVRQTQRLIQRSLLRTFEGDLQRGSATGRFRREEVRQRNIEGRRECPEQRQFGFASTVLDQRKMTRSPADRGTDLVKCQPLRLAVMAQSPSERQEIQRRRRDVKICHDFTITKELPIFRSVIG